jgi:spermidine synthase/tetratricopeptide (TPR) repeat protein/MFS family permease
MNRQTVYGFIALLFIVSGAAALMYQIVWFKYLSLFVGNTTYAQTIVLATFMGGLAIGASLWGARADRTERPLLLYAVLEFGIGIYCFFYPFLLESLQSLFVRLVHAWGLASDSSEVLLLKFVFSVLTLLLPTILMGGTLPVLVRFISQRIEEAGRNVATLYFLNSFGAVVGTFLCGFFFIPLVGLSVTITTAASLNVLVGLAALLLTRYRPMLVGTTTSAQSIAVPAEEGGEVSSHRYSKRDVHVAIGVAGLSGLTAMIYEVTWVRLLIPVVGSSTYSYTLMLVAFITGITLGSWFVTTFVDRIRNLFGFLALCQLGVGLSMAVMLPLYGMIPYAYWKIGALLSRTAGAYTVFLTLQFLFSISLMIVPTIFLGMTLPIASKIAARSLDVLGRSVGLVFSVNTMGTVIGSVAAGLVMIPAVGIRHTMEVAMILNVALALALAVVAPATGRRLRIAYAGLSVLIVAGYFTFSSDWNKTVMLSGTFRSIARGVEPPKTYRAFQERDIYSTIYYYKEGVSGTIGVVEGRSTYGTQRVLIVNGKADASSSVDLPTQVLLGQVPMMLHPQADTALVIGFGSGVTVGSMLTHPVQHVQCVEIAPEVIEASLFFDDVNHRPLSDRRSKLAIDDALSFLKLSATRYDVIVSEPSNPWIAGIGNLYTAEFWQLCRQRMRPGGLMVQWVQLYETNDEIVQMIIRTFQSVFPHISMWQSLVGDVLLVGSLQEVPLDQQRLAQRLEQPAVQSDLARIEIRDVATFLSLHMIGNERLREYALAGPLNTEKLPLLEYAAPRALFMNQGVGTLARFDERFLPAVSSAWLTQRSAHQPLTAQERLNIARYHSSSSRGHRILAYGMLKEYVNARPQDVDALVQLAAICEQLGRREEQVELLKRAAGLRPRDPDVLGAYARAKFLSDRAVASNYAATDNEDIKEILRRCIRLTNDTDHYYRVLLGDVHYAKGEYADAAAEYRAAIELMTSDEDDPRIRMDGLLYQLARSLVYTGERDRALGYALQATMINPEHEEAKDLVYSLWLSGNRHTP